MISVFLHKDFDPSYTLVGRGQFGEVYGTFWGRIQVVHKICLSKKNYDVFYNEVEILRRLSHPSIPIFYGVIREPLTLVMEYKKGVNLADHISNPNPYKNGTQTIRKIALAIASVLQYLHQKNIIFRDLKPDNLIFDPINEQISLVDFGLAIRLKKTDRMIRTPVVGTRGYIAPEILSHKMYSFPIDIFSYGKTIYCLFVFPYFEKYDRVPTKKNIDPFFWHLIERCCEQQPKDRPTIDSIIEMLSEKGDIPERKPIWKKLCCCFFYR
jgi:serine/threonine protein kinase